MFSNKLELIGLSLIFPISEGVETPIYSGGCINELSSVPKVNDKPWFRLSSVNLPSSLSSSFNVSLNLAVFTSHEFTDSLILFISRKIISF